jgi:hypothetical protein
MKRSLGMLLAFLLLVGGGLAQTTAPTKIVFSWSQPAGQWPSCSTSVTISCLTGLTLTDVTKPRAPVVVAGPNVLRAGTNTFTLTPLPRAGVHRYTLVNNARNNNGRAVTSAPANVSVTVPPHRTLPWWRHHWPR